MLILGSLSLFTFDNGDDYLINLPKQSNLFQFENNKMYCLKREMKKLISTLAMTYRHCQYMRMTGDAKLSKSTAVEFELSASVISVDKSTKEEKTLMLSSALAELAVDSKKDKQI